MTIPPALRVPEILWMICDHIRRDMHRNDTDISSFYYKPRDWAALEASQTILHLALTSKRVSETALDALWFRINGIESLVKCMGREVWSQDKYSSSPNPPVSAFHPKLFGNTENQHARLYPKQFFPLMLKA